MPQHRRLQYRRLADRKLITRENYGLTRKIQHLLVLGRLDWAVENLLPKVIRTQVDFWWNLKSRQYFRA